MDHFHYRNRILHCEDVPVCQLADLYGTPLFVYSKATLLHHLGQLQKAFAAVDPLICYSIKTNGKTDTSVKGVKFGLDIDTVLDVARGVVGNPHVRIIGLHMHLGSPILSTKPYQEGVAKGLVLIERLREQGHPIELLNMGGG